MSFDKIHPVQTEEKLKNANHFYNRVTEANIDYFHYWQEETFLHWDFWISTGFAIIPWIIWFKLHKKESRARLLLVGLFVIIITCWFDFIGTIYGFWYYTGKNIPTIPSYAPWDFCIFPVVIMLLIQYKPKMKPWKKALIFSGLSTFIGEPLFWWLGLYVIEKWNLLYSFPIYFIIYLLAHKISRTKTFEPI
jgi:hypothetical protein